MTTPDLIKPIERKEILSGAEVVGLYVYPIKSCGGTFLQKAEVTPTGIKHDRELMLVFPDGRFVSQRDRGCEKLAVVKPEFLEDGRMKLIAPNMPNLEFSITHEGQEYSATIHKTKDIQIVDQIDEASKWFCDYLGQEVKLVAMKDGYKRQTSQRWAPRTTDIVSLADGYNFLLISEESLNDLNTKLPQPIDMDAFRPNIVIKGNGIAYGEDEMAKIKIGDVIFDGVKPCIRCNITMVEQEKGTRRTGDMQKEPLRTLNRYRHAILKTGDKGPIFGMDFINENTGTIQIGDKVKILNTRDSEDFMFKNDSKI